MHLLLEYSLHLSKIYDTYCIKLANWTKVMYLHFTFDTNYQKGARYCRNYHSLLNCSMLYIVH